MAIYAFPARLPLKSLLIWERELTAEKDNYTGRVNLERPVVKSKEEEVWNSDNRHRDLVIKRQPSISHNRPVSHFSTVSQLSRHRGLPPMIVVPGSSTVADRSSGPRKSTLRISPNSAFSPIRRESKSNDWTVNPGHPLFEPIALRPVAVRLENVRVHPAQRAYQTENWREPREIRNVADIFSSNRSAAAQIQSRVECADAALAYKRLSNAPRKTFAQHFSTVPNRLTAPSEDWSPKKTTDSSGSRSKSNFLVNPLGRRSSVESKSVFSNQPSLAWRSSVGSFNCSLDATVEPVGAVPTRQLSRCSQITNSDKLHSTLTDRTAKSHGESTNAGSYLVPKPFFVKSPCEELKKSQRRDSVDTEPEHHVSNHTVQEASSDDLSFSSNGAGLDQQNERQERNRLSFKSKHVSFLLNNDQKEEELPNCNTSAAAKGVDESQTFRLEDLLHGGNVTAKAKLFEALANDKNSSSRTAVNDHRSKGPSWQSNKDSAAQISSFTHERTNQRRFESRDYESYNKSWLDKRTSTPRFQSYPLTHYSSTPNVQLIVTESSVGDEPSVRDSPETGYSSETQFEDERSRLSLMQKAQMFDITVKPRVQRNHRRHWDSRSKTQPVTEGDLKSAKSFLESLIESKLTLSTQDVSTTPSVPANKFSSTRSLSQDVHHTSGYKSEQCRTMVKPRRVVYLHTDNDAEQKQTSSVVTTLTRTDVNEDALLLKGW
ncbi:hypothetical protein TTRE_0000079101 [Trichuris trichiura]|uniref:Uncharacterized protein n=1 Tax=Trichuris trichiura TaxID=36087 RepID=A0A077YXL7_TRITR|nr:hypothetical protein TTRE_0000079101 [Trichuris trichiura]